MKFSSQQEQVKHKLAMDGKLNPVAVEKLKFPGLKGLFLSVPEAAKKTSTEKVVKDHKLKNFATLSRRNLAEALVDILIENKGVYAIEWNVLAGEVKLSQANFDQRRPTTEESKTALVDFLTMIIRCRAGLQNLRWTLSEEKVRFEYLPRYNL